ncbi:MAG: phosphoglycerate mutase family protein [Candidatus Saccharimonadales bacterium]
MRYLLIRHGKTDANRLTRAAFGKQGAPLNKLGIAQAKKLRKQLLAYGFNLATEPVAVSTLLRTIQTARHAGIQTTNTYSLLNEVKTSDPQHTQLLIERKLLPPEAVKTAKNILANPLKERIWVTHGLVIAAIMNELGKLDPDIFIPDFCKIIEIDL